MSSAFTFEQAVSAIERTSDAGLSGLQANLRHYFVGRPEELARLEAIMAPRLKPVRRATGQRSPATPRSGGSKAGLIGRSDVLAAIEEYTRHPAAFLELSRARDPKWVYLVDKADGEATRYPLKAIGLYLLRSEARDLTTNDVEREIDFAGLGFEVVRTLSRKAPEGDGA